VSLHHSTRARATTTRTHIVIIKCNIIITAHTRTAHLHSRSRITVARQCLVLVSAQAIEVDHCATVQRAVIRLIDALWAIAISQ
jgi:hypothetical protein